MAIYRFKAGSHIKADAQEAAAVCEKLANEGNLTARSLVDVSRPEDAPLHDEFDWNDTTAAESWREHQARRIIGSLEIIVEEKEPVRAFFSVVTHEPQYTHINAILRSEDETERLLRMAYRELQAFQRKYSRLEALRGVFEAIGKLEVAE